MMEERLRGGFIGTGQVVCEYAWPGYRSAGVGVDICKIGNRLDHAGTVAELHQRHEKNPSERNSIEDMLTRIDNSDITIHQTAGDHFDDDFFDDLDFVYIATPNWMREGFIRQAADAGVAMIIEKPIGHTPEVVQDITDTIGASGIQAVCAEHYSYKHPALWMFRNAPDLGRVRHVECCLQENDFLDADRYKWLLDPEKSGGGVWLDTGVHMLHLLNLAGVQVAEVEMAQGYTHDFSENDPRSRYIRGEVAAQVRVRLQSGSRPAMPGACADIFVGKCMDEVKKYFRIEYDEGTILLDFCHDAVYTDGRVIHFPRSDPYATVFREFRDHVCSGVESPTAIARTRASTDAVFRVYRHMNNGKRLHEYREAV